VNRLLRDGEHALDLGGVGGGLKRRVPKEGMDRGQPQIPAANAHAVPLFQVSEKRDNHRTVDLLEMQT
jgi:hypothetical protein